MTLMNVAALAMSFVEVLALYAAFRLYPDRKWASWSIAVFVIVLAYTDGAFFQGHHNLLLGLLP